MITKADIAVVHDLITTGRQQAAVTALEDLMRAEVDSASHAKYVEVRRAIAGEADAEIFSHADMMAWINRMTMTFDNPEFISELFQLLIAAKGLIAYIDGNTGESDMSDLLRRFDAMLAQLAGGDVDTDIETEGYDNE